MTRIAGINSGEEEAAELKQIVQTKEDVMTHLEALFGGTAEGVRKDTSTALKTLFRNAKGAAGPTQSMQKISWDEGDSTKSDAKPKDQPHPSRKEWEKRVREERNKTAAANLEQVLRECEEVTEAQRRYPELLKVSEGVSLKKRPAPGAAVGAAPVRHTLSGGGA